MFCEKCGKLIDEGKTLCSACAKESSKTQEDKQPNADNPTMGDSSPVENSEANFEENSSQNNTLESQKGICPSCGTSNGRNLRFCCVCGTTLTPAHKTIQQKDNEEKQEDENKQDSHTSSKKISKKTKITVCSVIASVVVALGVAVFAFWPQICALFGPKTDQAKQTDLSAERDRITGNIAGTIADFKDAVLNGVSLSSTADITIAEQFYPMIKALTEADIESYTNWIHTASLSSEITFKDARYQTKDKIVLNQSEVLDPDYIVDYNTLDIYLGFPSYQPQYWKGSMDLPMYEQLKLQKFFSNLQTVMSAIPDEQTLQNTLNRYINCTVSAAGSIEHAEVALSVRDITQNVNAHTIELSKKEIQAIKKEFINELKNDEIVKTFVANISSAAGISQEEFLNKLNEAEQKLNEEGDLSDETFLTIILYTDTKTDKILGWKLEQAGAEIKYYAVTANDQVGVFFKAPLNLGMSSVPLEFSGTGTKNNGKINGEFSLKTMGMDCVIFQISDYTNSGESGTVDIRAGSMVSSLVSNMANGVVPAYLPVITDMSLKYSWQTVSETEGNAHLEVFYQDGLACSVNTHSLKKNATEITCPSNSIYMDKYLSDKESLVAWLRDLDGNKLVTNLRNAKVPTETVNLVDTMYQIIASSGPLDVIEIAKRFHQEYVSPKPLYLDEWLAAIPPEYLATYTEDELLDAHMNYRKRFAAANGILSPDEVILPEDFLKIP